MLFSTTCKQGRIQLTEDGVLSVVSLFGQTAWSEAAQSIRAFDMKPGAMASCGIIVHATQDHLVTMIVRKDFDRLCQLIPVPVNWVTELIIAPPPAPAQPTLPVYPQPVQPQALQPPLHQPAPASTPPPYQPMPMQSPPRQTILQWYRSKSTNAQAGIGCLALLGVLLICGICAGSFNAAIAGMSPSSTTPTAQTTSANIAVNNASSPTIAPTRAVSTPTPKPKPTPTPKPAPTQKPAPTPTPKPKCQAVNNNPWCYNFNSAGGQLIYNPPSNFCDYFNCIASFWNGTGFVNECYDQTFSLSGGHQGDCSRHGGEWRPLYSH